MNAATLTLTPQRIDADTFQLGTYTPVPGLGVLPVNAFLLRTPQPVLVDTGLAAQREPFMAALEGLLDIEDLRWIWLTHTDPDHIGNLRYLLERAPHARVITTFLGMGKMGLLGLPLDRVWLLNPGQRLDVGDRELEALQPPCFDAPETTAIFDTRTATLFSADCFGSVLPAAAETCADIEAGTLQAGMSLWASIDAPWLAWLRDAHLQRAIDALEQRQVRTVLGSHLSPAHEMMATLLKYFLEATRAPAFVGPDQQALMQAMASINQAA